MAQTFTEQDRNDLKEIFRIYDFSKVEKVDDVVGDAVKKGTTPSALFDSFYKLYKIRKLPQREAVATRLHSAVPNASDADVESVMRQTEMKGFSEPDAIRSLERKYNVKHVTNRTLQSVRNNLNSVQDNGAGEQSELMRTTSSLRHVTVNESSMSSLSGNTSGHLLNKKNAANAQEEEGEEAAVVFARPPSHLSAAPTRENLDEIMAEEVREWLAKMLGEAYNSEVLALPNFVDALRNGLLLHVLLQKMQDPPVADADLKLPKRVTGFFIRDNVATFLKEAKKRYSLVDAQLFTDSDLVDGKSDRQVVTCLMAMARIAYSAGTIKLAPNIVMFEHEIEHQGNRLTKKDLDRIVEEAQADEDMSIPSLRHPDTAGAAEEGAAVGDQTAGEAGGESEFPSSPLETQAPVESAAASRPDSPPPCAEAAAGEMVSGEDLRAEEAADKITATPSQQAADAALDPTSTVVHSDSTAKGEEEGEENTTAAPVSEATPTKTLPREAAPSLDVSPPAAAERTLSPTKPKSPCDQGLTPERAAAKDATPVPSPPPPPQPAEAAGKAEAAESERGASEPPSEDLHTPAERGISPADAVDAASAATPAPAPAMSPATMGEAAAGAGEEQEDDKDGGGRVFYLRDGTLRPTRPTPEEEAQLQEQRRKSAPRVVWKSPASPLAATKAPRYHSRHWDGIDTALGRHLNAHYATHPQSPWRFHMVASTSGEYVLYNRQNALKRVVYLRIIQTRLFLRSSGKNQPWVRMDEALDALEKEH